MFLGENYMTDWLGTVELNTSIEDIWKKEALEMEKIIQLTGKNQDLSAYDQVHTAETQHLGKRKLDNSSIHWGDGERRRSARLQEQQRKENK